MSEDMKDKLRDSELFSAQNKGKYAYEQREDGGKSAFGVLSSGGGRHRNTSAQKSAGGDMRREAENRLGSDDGGHLIRARFSGSSDSENLTAQNRNLNRGAYKRLENQMDKAIKEKKNVYFSVDTSRGERPDYYSGYVIYEDQRGNRSWDAFSFTNESESTLENYEKTVEEYDAVAEVENEGASFSALQIENKKDKGIEY